MGSLPARRELDSATATGGTAIRDEAEINTQRFVDVFKVEGKMHSAWNTMIVSLKKGFYRLAEPTAKNRPQDSK